MNATRRILCVLSAVLGLAVPLRGQCRVKLPTKLADLEAAARRDSDDAAAHYNVGVAYCAAARYDDAEREFKLATTIEPQFAEPYLALSQLPFARRSRLLRDQYEHSVPDEWVARLKEADRMYARAFLIDPFVDVKIIGAVTPHDFGVNADIGEYYAEFLRDLFDGVDFFAEGKYDRAYTSFQRVYNELHYDSHADRLPNYLLWYHGIAAGHIQKYDDAIWDIQTLLNRFEQAEKSDSLIRIPLETNDYRYILACLKQRAGKLQEAADLFRSALEHDAGLYMAHTRLAQLYESVQRWPVAARSGPWRTPRCVRRWRRTRATRVCPTTSASSSSRWDGRMKRGPPSSDSSRSRRAATSHRSTTPSSVWPLCSSVH